MTVEYTGRQTEVTQQIRTLTERRLRKLSKLLRITNVHVILTTHRHRQIAEVSLHSPHLDLTATEESSDLTTSISTVFDKLARQAQRRVGKLRAPKRGASRATAVWSKDVAAPAADEGGPRVIRNRRFAVKPMTMDEAVLEVGDNADGFLVFRDASTERLNVLYRRKDGNLGLIEPEA